MNTHLAVVFTFILLLAGCSESSSKSSAASSAPDAKVLLQKFEETAQQSIFADLLSAISTSDHALAFAMLQPKLSEAWTSERFTQDWEGIKAQISDGWKPQLTSTFSGQSSKGAYEQATYSLDSDWRSIASVDMVSMQVDGQERIVRIYIRVPLADDPPEGAQAQVDLFVAAMLREDYKAAHEIFKPSARLQYPPALLKQLRPILVNSSQNLSYVYYRLCANTVWYDAVRIESPNDPATFLELIFSSGTDPIEIVSLSFKARTGM